MDREAVVVGDIRPDALGVGDHGVLGGVREVDVEHLIRLGKDVPFDLDRDSLRAVAGRERECAALGRVIGWSRGAVIRGREADRHGLCHGIGQRDREVGERGTGGIALGDGHVVHRQARPEADVDVRDRADDIRALLYLDRQWAGPRPLGDNESLPVPVAAGDLGAVVDQAGAERG